MDDPFAERACFTGSDRRRLATLATALPPGHAAWRQLPDPVRAIASAALRIMCAPV
jgi:hypothetical protein